MFSPRSFQMVSFHSRTMTTTGSNDIPHLRQLTPNKLREFLNSFEIILSDCDGVVWMMLGPIPGAPAALQLLKNQGKQVKFVSNNSLRSDKDYVEKFKKYGITDIVEHDVVHPAKLMAWYLKKHKPNCTVFPLISPASIAMLNNNGIATVPVALNTYSLDGVSFTKLVQEYGPKRVDAVLVDVNCFTSYTHLCKALQYLKDENCDLILGAMDTVLPLAENLHIPGFLDFYDILLKHSKKEPVILGKPSPLLGEFLKEHFSITNPKRCLFIGDSLRQDIGFAKCSGFQTLFVLSGGDTCKDMLNAPSEQKPDYYTESLADFIELLKDV